MAFSLERSKGSNRRAIGTALGVPSLRRTPVVPKAPEERTSSRGEPACARFYVRVGLSVGTPHLGTKHFV